MILKSNFDEIDFNELYKVQRARSSFGAKTKTDWDAKAAKFNDGILQSDYIKEFLRRVDFAGVRSVLDFACGPGGLSCLAAQRVQRVVACDFSQQMLKFVRENAADLGLTNVTTLQRSFDDDWSDIESVDVVFASRCLEVSDMRATLTKLISKANRALYLTFKVGGTFVDSKLLDVIERDVAPRPDFIYVINILVQMGYHPEISYINSYCRESVQSAEELIKKVEWGLHDTLNDAEKARLERYFERGGKTHKNVMNWAFMKVDTI